jgi:hypothetical protein
MSEAVLAVGGTGKRVVLLYLKLVNTLRPANVILPGDNVFVIDMEPEPNTPDAQLNQDLMNEGVPSSHFISPVPEAARVNRTITLSQFMEFDQGSHTAPLAHALFNSNQLNVQIIKGMNCEPTVGATVAARRFGTSTQEAEIRILESLIAPYDRFLIVGSVIGGTGAGVIPQLVTWIRHRLANPPIYGLLFLKWLSVTGGNEDEPNDAKFAGNAKAWLNYLLEHHPDAAYRLERDLFTHYVLIGAPQQMRLNVGNDNSHHPLHLLGAVYLLQFDRFLQQAPGATGPHYVELGAGIQATGIQMGTDTMANAIIREKLCAYLLQEFQEQQPDEALSAFTLMMRTALAWRQFIRTMEVIAAKWDRRDHTHDDWVKVTDVFDRERRKTEDRIEQLKKLTITMPGASEIFDFDWNQLLQQSEAKKADARAIVKRNLKEVIVAFPNLDEAYDGIGFGFIEQLRSILRQSPVV